MFQIIVLMLVGAANPARAESLDAFERLMEKAAVQGFTGFASVSRGETVLWEKGYGQTRPDRPDRIGAQTLFDVGSVTKQFTATALLDLEVQGRLRLDDSLAKYFRLPNRIQDVTIRQGLQHVTGIGYPPEDSGIDWSKLAHDPLLYFETLFGLAKYFPQRSFYYNNIVYTALAQIVADTSGQPFEAFVKTQLYPRAKMVASGFNVPGSVDLEMSAMGFEEGKAHYLAGELPSGIGYYGATGAITNARELRAWLLAVSRGQVLPREATDQLFAAPAKNPGYALGWGVERANGELVSFSHSGATVGFFSLAVFYPRGERSLMLLGNRFETIWLLDLAKRAYDGQIPLDRLDEEIRRAKQRGLNEFKSRYRMDFTGPMGALRRARK